MNEDEYKVGYKNPPKERRFPKGVSGNPKGRAKSNLSISASLHKEMATKITTVDNGKTEKISKEAAMAKRLVRSAASGNFKAIKRVFKILPPEEVTYQIIGYDSQGNRLK